MANFDARLDLVPESPGVYLMKDAEGSVIYVGKAINLRRRLRSYFTTNPKGSLKVLTMIDKIVDFDFLICANELEALLLESNLIKQYQPFFNVLLKDNHDYPYICISWQDEYPRIFKAYRIGSDKKQGAKYYGPYLNGDLNRALKTIHRIFPLKTCRRVFPRDVGKDRPCLNYHIKRCIAPCLGTVESELYRDIVKQVADFLEGNYGAILDNMQLKMQTAAQNLDFETAGAWRDRIVDLRTLIGQAQRVIGVGSNLVDAFALVKENNDICVQKLEVRNGKVSGTATFFLQGSGNAGEILTDFIVQHYSDIKRVPQEIILDFNLKKDLDISAFSQWLASLSSEKIKILLPIKGAKYKLLQLAKETANQALLRHVNINYQVEVENELALNYLQELCGLATKPQRLEAYDISNNGSQDMVGAMVVWQNNRLMSSQYRDFKIQYQTGIDDYKALREVISRRLEHIDDKDFGSKPNLLLLDGGIGHVHTIQNLLQSKKIDLAVAGMVKNDKHRTRGLVKPNGEILELLGAEDKDQQINVKNKALLKFLTRLQDETHRRAIRANRKQDKKRQLRYRLEDIAGVGTKRRNNLLNNFSSLQAIAQADISTLMSKADLPLKTAEAVYKYFNNGGRNDLGNS